MKNWLDRHSGEGQNDGREYEGAFQLVGMPLRIFRLRNQLDRKFSGINKLPGNEFS